jgi:hypothetical protein
VKRTTRKISVFLVCIGVLTTSAFPRTNDKKLIFFNGGAINTLTYDMVNANIATWQSRRPFIDGVVVRITPDSRPPYIFNKALMSDAEVNLANMPNLASKWTTMTENFVLINASNSDAKMNFFDDALWANINANARKIAKAAKLGGFRGVMFDPEIYTGNINPMPWWYSYNGVNYYPTYTFDQVTAKARQRGREFMNAMESEYPGIVFNSTFMWGAISGYTYGVSLQNSFYALYKGFADGLLEAADPGTVIVDGNESSYNLDDARKYVESWDGGDYLYSRVTARDAVVAPELMAKHSAQVQIAFAPSAHTCYGYLADNGHPVDYKRDWLKHQVYHSLLNTDQYAWIWWETNNFFEEQVQADGITNAQMAADISEAKSKLLSGQALGYELSKTSLFQYNANVQNDRLTSPSALLVSPANGDEISLTSPTAIQVVVAPLMNIDHVEFYVNSLNVGTARSAPYQVSYRFSRGESTVYARVFLMASTTDKPHVSSNPIFVRTAADGFVEPFPIDNQASAHGINSPDGKDVSYEFHPDNEKTVTVKYQLFEKSIVDIKLFNRHGDLVRQLVNDERMAGQYDLLWDGRNASGQIVPSGTYMLLMQLGNVKKKPKIVVIR